MFILSLGGLVNGNLDQAMMLGNTINRDYSEIINSYVLKIGMANFRFDYAADLRGVGVFHKCPEPQGHRRGHILT